MKTKRLTCILLCALLCFSLAACSSAGTDESEGEANEPVTSFTVGIVQIVEHPSLDEVREAAIAQLAAEGFVEGQNLNIDYQNASGDQTNLNSIVQKFVSGSYDLIIAIATPSAQAAQGATSDIPIIFAAVTDPVDAALVDSLTKPGKNITGTSDYINAGDLMNVALQISPDIQKIGALYCTAEANSVSTVNELKAWASEKGYEVVDGAYVNSNEVQQAVLSLASKADAIFIPQDNTTAAAMATVAQAAIDAGLPTFCAADSLAKDGGLAAFGINYTNLGTETGKMAAKVLTGTPVGDIDVMQFSDYQVNINTTTAQALGITIPQEILDDAVLFE